MSPMPEPADLAETTAPPGQVLMAQYIDQIKRQRNDLMDTVALLELRVAALAQLVAKSPANEKQSTGLDQC